MSSTATEVTFLDRLSNNLRLIGALSYDEFLALPARPVPDVPEPSYAILQFSSESNHAQPAAAVSHKTSLGKLYEACQTAFPGAADVLQFSYEGQGNQCILTITRPNSGMSRTYKSDTTFVNRKEAKEQVCDRAMAFHADRFILQGDTTKLRNVAALDAEDLAMPDSEPPKSRSVQEVEDVCAHLNLHVKWYTFESNQKIGAALRVSWSPSAFKDYACLPNYDTVEQAKSECAQNALTSGLCDLAKAPKDFKYAELPSTAISLQAYFDSLPRPFPEPELDKTLASDVEISGWMNTLIQGAKGTFVKTAFCWFTENGLQGYVLIVFKPGGESRTYIAEGRFSKRVEAKCAAIFLAMSEGVGPWIRELKKKAAERITPEMRKQSQTLAQTLATVCKQLSGRIPSPNIVKDQDAFSATLAVHLSNNDVRTYSVPSEYCSKAEAKTAVYLEAAKDAGLMEIVERNAGKNKRKGGEREAGEVVEPPKKKWKGKQQAQVPIAGPSYTLPPGPPYQNAYMGMGPPHLPLYQNGYMGPPPPQAYMYPPPHLYYGPPGYQ